MMRWPLAVVLFAACVPDPPPSDPHDDWDDKLAEREVDYNAALRIAALRLTGELPTLVELDAIASAPNQKVAYEEQIQRYLGNPKFARQMYRYAQDMLKMGDDPQLDTAAAFVAQVVINDRPYLDVLTATSGTCPSFNPATSQFTPGNCSNNAPATVGLLTHPGVQKHYFSNLAFRRVRWLQETFACTKFPAEIAKTATNVGGTMPYTGVFPFDSIAGAPTGRVDFKNTASVICANCHSNINHIAPLFAHFDADGRYTDGFAVPVPLPDNPPVEMRDYLPNGEGLAWRFGVPISDMTSLGRAMAADPTIAECAIARVWDWAMGKNDIVDGGARVPSATIEAQVAAFVAGGYSMKDAMYRVFTSDDFVRF
ncbi:MAG TPA: hypothetical protein VFV99_09245 [Kofleriaceae bacterium]|nr:hypothetical protein [Kofleriaceae bacterium]